MAINQTKPWFEANRDRYERYVRGPAVILAEEAGAALSQSGSPLSGDAKRSMFRINRDVRFSKDKRPYKTHAGLVWMRPGFKKISPGILYLHVAPDGCFLATGFYGLDRPVLDALRTAIRYDPETFSTAVAAAAQAGLALDLSDTMIRLPRGFDDVTDPALIPVLKTRHLILKRPLSRRDVGGPGLVGALVGAARAGLPFLQFGWDAVLDEAPPPDWSRLQ